LVPYFSLYSRDLKRPDDLPLLVQLIRSLDADPTSFALKEVLLPVIDCWAGVLKEKGLLLESHGQNLLLELDREGRPRRVVHRDLDVWFDPSIRQARGLAMPFLGEGVGAEHPREQYLSLIYDWFVGHHLFDYIARVLERHCGVDPGDLRAGCREVFRRHFPDVSGWFPKETTYYFSDLPQPENGYALVDTRQAPVWR
jgi:siderophore synthetase component